MAANTIDTLDWEAFIHKFSVYKKLSGINGDAGSHFLDFWKRGLFCFIQHIWGRNEFTEWGDIMHESEEFGRQKAE